MNNVFAWGAASAGQLGFAPAPADASRRNGAEEELERRAEQPLLQLSPVRLPGGLGARCTVSVACGENHTVALDRLGYVWSFGRNREARRVPRQLAEGPKNAPGRGLALGNSSVPRRRKHMPRWHDLYVCNAILVLPANLGIFLRAAVAVGARKGSPEDCHSGHALRRRSACARISSMCSE